jgi:hypothetical protein
MVTHPDPCRGGSGRAGYGIRPMTGRLTKVEVPQAGADGLVTAQSSRVPAGAV